MNTATINIDDYTTEQLEQILAERHEKQVAEQMKKRQDYETLKEDLINDACTNALKLHTELKDFKVTMFNECAALYAMLQEYSNRHADGEGNFSIENKAQTFKVMYSRQSLGYFDERSVQAEKHIIDFVNKQFAGDATTHKLITSLLERTKDTLDIKLVQKLYSMENDYTDTNWKEGIRLLKESWTPAESKDYIRFYTRSGSEWSLININFSSIKL